MQNKDLPPAKESFLGPSPSFRFSPPFWHKKTGAACESRPGVKYRQRCPATSGGGGARRVRPRPGGPWQMARELHRSHLHQG